MRTSGEPGAATAVRSPRPRSTQKSHQSLAHVAETAVSGITSTRAVGCSLCCGGVESRCQAPPALASVAHGSSHSTYEMRRPVGDTQPGCCCCGRCSLRRPSLHGLRGGGKVGVGPPCQRKRRGRRRRYAAAAWAAQSRAGRVARRLNQSGECARAEQRFATVAAKVVGAPFRRSATHLLLLRSASDRSSAGRSCACTATPGERCAGRGACCVPDVASAMHEPSSTGKRLEDGTRASMCTVTARTLPGERRERGRVEQRGGR